MSLIDLWEGDSLSAWEAHWGVPRLEIHDLIGSTNDRARELAEMGAQAFTAVIAEGQSAGRGRSGRRWESPRGSGLWVSIVAPRVQRTERSLVSLRAGLATCRAVERAAPGVRAGFKWPNDVLLAGRKVSGILCEGGPGTIVVGVGVNVRAGSLPADLTDVGVALDEVAAEPVDRAALAGFLVAELRALLAGVALSLEGGIGRELDARDVLRDRAVAAETGEVGIARGIDRDGALRVEVEPGRVRRVVAGGVRIRAD